MRSLTFGSSKTGVRTAAVAAVLLFELSQVGASPITSIIAPGDLLPTRDGSQPFVDVSDFQVNDQGQVATVGQLPGPTTAVWLYTPGTGVTLVSQRGDFAPGTAPAMNFTHNDNDTRVKLNDLGQVLIKSEANVPDEPLTRALGYWLWDSAGALHPVYLTGTPAPGLPAGSEIADAGGTGFLTNTGAAVEAEVRPAGSSDLEDAAYWWKDGQLELLASGRADIRATNDGSQVLVELRSLTEPSVFLSLSLFDTQSDQPPQTIIASAQELPGTDPPAPLTRVGDSQVTDVGQVFFAGDANELGGLWRWEAGIIEPVLAPGDELLGEPVVEVSSSSANDRGDVAFVAQFDTVPGSGIWVAKGDDIDVLLTAGQSAPGTNESLRFGSFRGLQLNDRGQLAFSATLFGDDTDAVRSIWAVQPEETPLLIMREGDTLEISPGDERLVTTLGVPEFNELGQVFFSARFDDETSGVFLSNVVAVPEPSAGVLLLVALVTLVSCQTSVIRR